MGGASGIGGGGWYPEYPEYSETEDLPFPATGGALGYGGEPVGIGGDWAIGGSDWGVGGSGNPSNAWCESEESGTVLAGFSFAVGACQDVDVALPLVFEEPYSGEYELVVFGSYTSCERGTQLSKVAGIGAGQILEVPVNTSGYSFITVEYRGQAYYYDFGIRLRDRPRVVPTPSE